MMTAKIDINDLVTCPICYEQFTNPKCLPCHHTFCLQCLKSYIITQHGGEGQKAKGFPCPVCRQVVMISDTNLASENIADSMPGNHMITSLIERSMETPAPCEDDGLCGPCFSDNENIIAVFWCACCLEPLCENCVKYHKRIRKSKHEIISIEEMTKTKEKTVELLDIDEPCMKHAGKVLEVYCVDHKEKCCVICLTTSHRKCEHVCTFEEMITGSKENEPIEQFAEFLNEIEKKTDDLRIKTDVNLATLKNGQDKLSKQVSTMVQQAKDKLDHLHSSFQSQSQQIHKEESLKLTETKERIEIFHQNVKRGQKLLQTIREQGSPKQVFITKEKLKQQIKHHMEGLKVDLKDTHCIEYILNTDDAVTSIIKNLTSVAEVQIKTTLDLSTSLSEVSAVVDCLYKENEPIDVMAFEAGRLHSVNPGGEITGVTCLPDGRLVLICCTRNKILVYDQTLNNIISKCNVVEDPADVCLISVSEIAVSFNECQHLQRYEILQNTIKENSKIPCKSQPWGLASTKDYIIVGYESEIDVLSLSGQFIRTLSSRVGDHVSCVTVSLTGNVYYSDRKYVVCKTLDGREIRRFTNPNLDRVAGIEVDKHDNVFVCGYDSDNVVVFSPDGKTSKILLTNTINCCGIGFDPTETNFYVGTATEGCHFYSLRK